MSFTSKTYSCGSLGRVRRLDNLNHGQANWINVPVTQAATNGKELLDIETAPNNGDLVFTVGYAAGSLASPLFHGVAVSNNGGVTWNIPGGNYLTAATGTVDNGNTFKWNEIIVVGPQVYGVSGFSVIVGSVDTGTFHGAIATSNDGGATYNSLQWYNNLLSAPNPIVADMECTAVHFPNANIGVVALWLPGALTGWVIKTTDGGGTWLIMNGQNFLTTASFPNPPATTLPIGAITGISILANQEHIIGVGADFIVETIPVTGGSPTAGVATDSWKNNFLTSQVPGGPPVSGGFYMNPFIPTAQPIGWHLGTYPVPYENVIWVGGDSELGVHSIDHGASSWTVAPAPGWDINGTGFGRRASHFYKYTSPSGTALEGFWNYNALTGNRVYWGSQGYAAAFNLLSDDLPGLTYSPTAIWTWYEEVPVLPCYTLTDCLDGTTIVTNTNLSAYIGQTITIVEAPDRCFVVTDGCIQGAPFTPVTFVASFVDCTSCMPPPPSPCACPQGTIQVTLPDGSVVCREDVLTLAEGPRSGFCQKLTVNEVFSPQYCRYGAKFYPETSGLSWPISFASGCTPGSQAWNAFPATPVPSVATISNPAWGTGAPVIYDGRFNDGAGVTYSLTTPCPVSGTTNERIGFTHCLNVPSTTTYSFGFAGMGVIITINGIQMISSGNEDIYLYENWNVFQITLPAGSYIIQAIGMQGGGTDLCGNFSFNNPPLTPKAPGSSIGFGFEIYQATTAALSGMITPGQVNAAVVYSTKNEVGQPMDYGSTIMNYRCPCELPPVVCPSSFGNYNIINPILDNCTANSLNPNANPLIYVCHTYKYTALEECCYLLTDCTNPAIYYITSTNLSLVLGEVITVQEYVGCFIVSQVPCGPVLEPTVTLIQSYGPESSGGCEACAPKCYIVTDCKGIIPSFIVNTNLSQYVGQVISLCPTTPAQGARGEGGNTQNFTDQVVLTDCCNPTNKIRSFPPSGAYLSYFGQTVVIPSLGTNCWVIDPVVSLIGSVNSLPSVAITWSDPGILVKQGCGIDCLPCAPANPIITECGCFTVDLSNSCMGSIPLPGTITGNFIDCDACAPKCYLLVDCADPNHIIISNTNLSLYVGQVIYIEGCPGVCWQVNISLDCTGAIPVVFQEAFVDCEACSPTPPPPPLELRIRSVKPGYTTPGCDPAYTEKVSCNFGSAVYDQMVILRYGITMCCNLPVDKWDIKMQLLQLAAIYDPTLCKDAFEKCCAPCGMVAKLTVYYPVLPICPAPTNMQAVLTVPPAQCPAPTNMQGAIILNPTQPCVCYLIIPEPGAPCDFDYVNCDGVPMMEFVFGPTYLCSSVQPTTKCATNYTIQTTPANCLNGECHP